MSSSMMSTPNDAPEVTAVVEDTPAVVEDTPAADEDTPAVVDDTPAADEDTPATDEDTPQHSTTNVAPSASPDGQVNLLSVPINNENDALNVLIGFLSVAQRRGVFAINEAAKIFECVKKFHR